MTRPVAATRLNPGKRGRAAECIRLESGRRETVRGFESLRFRRALWPGTTPTGGFIRSKVRSAERCQVLRFGDLVTPRGDVRTMTEQHTYPPGQWGSLARHRFRA